jgi:chromosome partitioning protein
MRQVELFKEEDSGTVLEREPNSTAARSIIDLAKSLIKEYDLKISGIRVI